MVEIPEDVYEELLPQYEKFFAAERLELQNLITCIEQYGFKVDQCGINIPPFNMIDRSENRAADLDKLSEMASELRITQQFLRKLRHALFERDCEYIRHYQYIEDSKEDFDDGSDDE